MLNPELYRQLNLAVQKGAPHGLPGGEVLIAKEDMEMEHEYKKDPRTGNYYLEPLEPGESYRVCCPNCGDTRHRLYINHRWRVYDETTRTRNTWLVHCFNENCEKTQGFVPDLIKRLNPLQNRVGAKGTQENTIRVSDLNKGNKSSPLHLPEGLVPLSILDESHPAKEFLKNRGLSPDKLSKYWDVSYCDWNINSLVHNRVIFPIKMQNELYAWQARYLGNTDNLYLCGGQDCDYMARSESKPDKCPQCFSSNFKSVPKWYTGPGSQINKILYNYDNAKKWPFVVLTEGIFDAVHLGTPSSPDIPGPGVCVFSHSLGYQQKHLILSNLTWNCSSGLIVLLFDPELWLNEKESSRVNKLIDSLQSQFRGSVLPVVLKDNLDPADTPHESLWLQICEAADKNNIEIPMKEIK